MQNAPMQNATIVVKYINPAKPGKKNATLKDADGGIWLIPPASLGQYTVNATYDVGYEEFSIAGNTFRSIKSSKVVGEAPTAAPPSTGGYGVQDKATAERIFVCGAVNATLGNPSLDPSNLTTSFVVELVTTLRDAWAVTFGRQEKAPDGAQAKKPAKNDDMNDEVPF